ncbi:MAG: hypothetical protein Q8M99_01910 [Methylotenera sp.]|nr:hypothetical protein [Methylotenera sp.]
MNDKKAYLCWLLMVLSTTTYAANNNIAKPLIQQAPRDPFATTDKMYMEVNNQSSLRNNPYGSFVPGYGMQNSPKMKLKGFVAKNKSQATALLEVEGAGVYMVSAGDEIGLHMIGMQTVLKIIEVTSNGVKVQPGHINQVIVVR